MLPKHKRPSVLKAPIPEKKPVANTVDWWSLTIAWRIGRMEFCDPYGWHEVDRAKIRDIQQKLGEREKLTLREIFVQQEKHNHPVPVERLEPGAQRRLQKLRLYDVEELYTIRIEATERVWGILDQNVMTLLWWDPNHQVCPSLRD